MRRIRLTTALLVLVTILLTVAAANASAQNVPPGVSGANQYTETLPGPGGNSPTSGGTSNGGGTSGPKSVAKALGAENARKLQALGPEGKAAAQLATESSSGNSRQTRHAHRGRGSGDRTRSSGQTGGATGSQDGSSGVQQILGQITGTGGSNSGGMTWLLPLLIGVSVVVAAAYIFARNRPARPQE
jgi:hypothetical protein